MVRLWHESSDSLPWPVYRTCIGASRMVNDYKLMVEQALLQSWMRPEIESFPREHSEVPEFASQVFYFSFLLFQISHRLIQQIDVLFDVLFRHAEKLCLCLQQLDHQVPFFL